MAEPITDPAIIKFVNETIRPMCEQLRKGKLMANACLLRSQFFAESIPNDDTLINDGRAGEGVMQLTGADVHAVLALVTTYVTQGNDPSAYMAIEKPCVRGAEVY